MVSFLRSWRLAAGLVCVGVLVGSGQALAQQGPVKQWDKTFGGNASNELTALQQTSDGGYILGGYSDSPASGDKTESSRGDFDYWIVKVNAQGTKQWDKTLGGSGRDQLVSVEQTRDGGYILGGFSTSDTGGDKTEPSRGSSDYWIVKLDAQGNKQWDRTVGGSAYDGLQVTQQTNDGGYILGGWSYSGISGEKTQPNRGRTDYWVVKLDAQGTKQWDKTLGGDSYEELYTLQQTNDGGYILGGASYSGISGDKTQPSQGNYDYWLVKLDAQGSMQWDRAYGGSSSDRLRVVKTTTDGGYILGGWSESNSSGDKSQPNQGQVDYWVLKINAQGNKQWDGTFGGNSYEYLYQIQQTSDGGYLLGGDSYSGVSGNKTQPSKGGYDQWFVKINAQGTKQWEQTYGGDNDDFLRSVQPTIDQGYIVGGYSRSGVSGDKTDTRRGFLDYWVIKLSPDVITATSSTAARQALHLYPNPAHDQLTLRLPTDAPRTGLRLTLLDATGRTVLARDLVAASTEVAVTVGEQPAGLYLVRVEGANGFLATQRLVLH